MKNVTLLFLVQDDQFLLAMKKRGFGEGRYNGVGGKVESGESIEEATIRECQEEIGVTPEDIQKVAILTFRYAAEDGKSDDVRCHVFVAHSWEGEPIESEEMAPEWFYADMLPYDHMWPDDRHWLPLVIEGHSVTGEFSFNPDKDMVGHQVSIVDPTELE